MLIVHGLGSCCTKQATLVIFSPDLPRAFRNLMRKSTSPCLNQQQRHLHPYNYICIIMTSAGALRPAPLISFIQRLAPRHTRNVTPLFRSHIRAVSSVASCPSPSCACQDMPPDLDIERDKPLDGTMAAYHEHVMIPTGRVDWTSRIEEDPGLPFIKQLKDALGQKGKYSNVCSCRVSS